MAHRQAFEAKNGPQRFLPSTAHEVDATLIIEFGSAGFGHLQHTSHCIESPDPDVTVLPQVFVRLGTQVNDDVPSHLGFRVFLQKATASESDLSSVLEDNYAIASFRFLKAGSSIIHRPMTGQEQYEETRKCIRSDAFAMEDKTAVEDLSLTDMYGLVATSLSRGPICDVSPFRKTGILVTEKISRTLELIPLLPSAKRVTLFFPWDSVLCARLQQTIDNDGKGHETPSWKTPLPESSLRTWPYNKQTQMVRGSTAVLNVMAKLNRQPLMYDGPGTDLDSRPQAQRFKEFVHEEYPTIEHEAKDKVYPIFLHVQGLCIELPFGAYMINRENICAGLNLVRRMLDNGIDPSSIAIVTVYPAQAEAYKEWLRHGHDDNPDTGYDKVSADFLENWVGEEAGIVIVDLVRTANASGNLGLLSQIRRLQVSMSLHRDGLVVIGDRRCTLAADDTILSTKLEKVFQWFEDNGRVVQVAYEGSPLSQEQQVPFSMPKQHTNSPATPPNMRRALDTTPAPQYVGIPELDPSIKKKGVPKSSESRKSSVLDPFTRQKLILALEDSTRPVDTRGTLDSQGTGNNADIAKGSAQKPTFDFSPAIELPPSALNALYRSQNEIIVPPQQVSPSKRESVDIWDSHFKKPLLDSAADQRKYTLSSLLDLRPRNDPATQSIDTMPISKALPSKFDDWMKSQEDPVLASPRKDGKAALLECRKSENDAPPPSGSVAFNSNHSKQDSIEVFSLSKSPKVVMSTDTPDSKKMTNAMVQRSVNALSPRKSLSSTVKSPEKFASIRDVFFSPPKSQHPATPTAEKAPHEQTIAPSFQTRYRAKYQALRTLYTTIHDTTLPSRAEDQLFRRLADAYILEDAKAFDQVYMELLRMAAELQTGQMEMDTSE